MTRHGDDEDLAHIQGVTVEHETDLALLCVVDGRKHWVPKSQIRDESEVKAVGDEGTLVIPAWLASDKGIE